MEFLTGLVGVIVGFLLSIGRDILLTSKRRSAILEELNEFRQFILLDRERMLDFENTRLLPNEIKLTVLDTYYPEAFLKFTTNQRQIIRTIIHDFDEYNRLTKQVISQRNPKRSADSIVSLIKITIFK